MKLSSLFLIALLAITFIPSVKLPDLNGNQFEFDAAMNEGFIAFAVNAYEQKETPDVKTECECKGTGTITHGDGHKTPCPYVNPATGKCEFGKTVSENIKKKMSNPFLPLSLEEFSNLTSWSKK